MNASSETLIRNSQIEWSGELLSASFPRLFAPPMFVWTTQVINMYFFDGFVFFFNSWCDAEPALLT